MKVKIPSSIKNNKIALAEWRTIIRAIDDAGNLTEENLSIAELTCLAYAEYISKNIEIEEIKASLTKEDLKNPNIRDRGDIMITLNGYPQEHPRKRLMATAFQQFLSGRKALMLTQDVKERLKVQSKKSGDSEIDEILESLKPKNESGNPKKRGK